VTTHELLAALLKGEGLPGARAAVEAFEQELGARTTWEPLGRANNVGTIEVAADPGRSVVERLTNGIDAILEAEHDQHHGLPACRSPREAAVAWLAVPPAGLSALTVAQRRHLANRVLCSILPGESPESRIVEVRDFGIGLTPSQMPDTILSLNESNKIQKHYLAGLYGQGGSSTFAVSKLSLIASRFADRPTVGFTVVKYLDLPPEEYRTGRYVYLKLDGAVLEAPLPTEGFPAGTLVRHYGYDLSRYPNPFGEKSVYGLLNRVLFDPILPVFLDNGTFKTKQRRVIKGSRNALNGAVDEGDDEETKGPDLSHHMPLSSISLGDWGVIGLEYWVLEPAKSGGGQPTRAFVHPRRPIVLTLNGQNHDERPHTLITQDAELPYLGYRLICNVNCDNLTALGKRALFVSTREGARHGMLSDQIDQEVVRALQSDDELERINNEAAEKNYQEEDAEAVLQMRREVAKILRVQGIKLSDMGPVGGSVPGGPGRGPRGKRGPRKKLEPLDLHEPPTYVRILWDKEAPVEFFPGLRRYLRIETDANSNWHDSVDPHRSKFNVIVLPDSGLASKGTTALSGGRMRMIVEAGADAKEGTLGTVRIELMRPGLPTLFDERPTVIVREPEGDPDDKKMALPEFKVIGIDHTDGRWVGLLGWPEDTTAIASSAQVDKGVLVVYYSTEYPKYLAPLRAFEKSDPNQARSFKKRYETWLAVHSLLFYQDQQQGKNAAPIEAGAPTATEDPDVEENRERQERIRIATLSSLFAAREVKLGGASDEDDGPEG
jgi:hypothetical protein